MTAITYEPNAYRFTADGHAQGGEYGQDIVCAAVSMLTGTLASALECYGMENTAVIRDGFVEIRALPGKQQEQRCRTIFETVAAGAELLAAKEPGHVSFTIV